MLMVMMMVIGIRGTNVRGVEGLGIRIRGEVREELRLVRMMVWSKY